MHLIAIVRKLARGIEGKPTTCSAGLLAGLIGWLMKERAIIHATQ
jgi:hypothetical protein